MSTPTARTVLVSGASIAGPTLAYWLHRYGFDVTVVEKADRVRGGGYPVDIRGSALGVVERMGLLPPVRAAHVDSRRITFLDAAGDPVASIRPEALTGGVEGRDVELRRGDLTDILYGAVRDDVGFRFADSIAALHEHAGGVDVTFRSGVERTYDLVAGADGLHSATRALAFGPEERFHHYLGRCFAGFTVPNEPGPDGSRLSHEAVAWNAPGRAAVLYAPGETDRLHAFLSFALDDPPLTAHGDPGAQRDLVAAMFPDDAWEVPRLVAAMRAADDLYFDVVSQIRMPAWSAGRVGLVGDAACAASFVSGQGSSVALVGAYVLAGELAAHRDHRDAFAAYERAARGFVEANQALATAGGSSVAPRTPEELERRNRALREGGGRSGGDRPAAHTAITLADYALVP
jgi:2-polyprenyl-6-methoxyphenol hydroxylase-like FAD-dependent oxidoreductase